ncbi:MAG TPA: carboxylating nicotinate-nucleotide diphosphorylase [Actinocatenispora sp.]
MIDTVLPREVWPRNETVAAVRAALAEDAVTEDLTTRWSVPAGASARAAILAREPGVLAGLPALVEVFQQVDPAVRVETCTADGAAVGPGTTVARLAGSAAAILTGERVALNFLQRMSGIATMAARLVEAVDGFGVTVLDTRKTAPGLRALDKYAVRAGGATNHRRDLSAMVLLKENHLTAAGGVTAAVGAVRRGIAAEQRAVTVAVEVGTVEEAREAFAARTDWVLLDNMPLDVMREVVALRDRSGYACRLEASGQITLETAAAVAATGVDAMSVGALTHSVRALDLSLLLETVDSPELRDVP